ncbi:hypothetical protein CesoFtcFv8_016212 [Champsocephalus esox]|uniref:G2/mitotic-specific cyclin-B2 n=1 Tax=Champsocephalus esox TaxID=159716 RepID=A0AAN8BLU0_9TELE|nr:hypothetical protein CesoFtcFv8_016212 [Champsocephalus esox]
MNFSTNAHSGSHASKENIPHPVQVQRGKQRIVLGVLSENDYHGRSCSQGSQFSKQSSISDSSHLAFLGRPSSSSFDIYVEEACEVVLAPSGQEVVSESYNVVSETTADLRFLTELSISSGHDASMQSEQDESLMSKEMLCVSEYAKDIHLHLREREIKSRPKPGYLEKHPEITNGMRVILVDWLVEVVQEYRLRSETLHLAVNYLDRFLSATALVKRGKLQLVGTAALMIAAKYEEICPPELNDFFVFSCPSTPVCTITENLAQYVAELSLLEIDPFLQYTPSLVAAGAYCLAAYIVNKSLWPDSLNAFTGYTTAEIGPCMTALHKLYISAESCPQQAIREKYKTSKYFRVSLITAPDALPFHE